MYLSLYLFLSLYLSVFFAFFGQVMFSYDPHRFCEVSVWSGRPEGFESKGSEQLLTKVGLELLGQLKKLILIGRDDRTVSQAWPHPDRVKNQHNLTRHDSQPTGGQYPLLTGSPK